MSPPPTRPLPRAAPPPAAAIRPPPPRVANRRARRACLQPKPVKSGLPPHVTLRRALPKWRAIGASPWVLRTIQDGLHLPWRCRPPAHHARPIRLPPDEATWAVNEVRRWETQRFVRRATGLEAAAARWSSSTFVVDAARKPRLVIDYRYPNGFLSDRGFRYEQISAFVSRLSVGDHMASWDASDAFHHIRLAPRESARLAFTVAGVLYYPLTLPFGLKLSPWAWTKLLRPVIAWLRQRGYSILPYMDDFACTLDKDGTVSKAEATAARATAVALFAELGIHVHPSKGTVDGTTRLEILGFVIDTDRCLLLLPPARRHRVTRAAHSLLRAAATHRRWVPTRALQQFCGLAGSCALAVPMSRMRLRSLFDGLTCFRARSRLPSRALSDLLWWSELGSAVAVGRALFQPPVTMELDTDASSYGWGAVRDGLTPARGFFSLAMRHLHINHKELLAIRYALESFPAATGPGVVRVRTDSRVVHGIINAMSSRSPRLMAEVRDLHQLLKSRDLSLESSWLASVENVWADRLSRDRDHGGRSLAVPYFSTLDAAWGPATVDRFASPLDTKLARFNSLHHTPGCDGVDAFSLPWAGELNYAHPPLAQVSLVLDKVRRERATAIVIVPVWPAQAWWRRALLSATASVLLPPTALLDPPCRPPGRASPPRWRTAALLLELGGRRDTGSVGGALPTLASWPPSALPAPARMLPPAC